jgi:hypothetical protein
VTAVAKLIALSGRDRGDPARSQHQPVLLIERML